MQVKFWDPKRAYQKHKAEIDAAITGCLERGELVLGYLDQITNFEKTFAEYIGVKHAIMVGSGTQALRTAYQAVGLKKGDEVITTSHTFIATIDQIVASGAKPVLVDIDPLTGLIDPEKIKKAITNKTRAIVPVHLEGKVCDMDAINKIAQEYKLWVIEDAAQAIGATSFSDIFDDKIGSLGDIGCFSLYPAKILGCVGNAGMITTDDDRLAERAQMIRCNYNIGRQNKSTEDAEYGHNFEPDAIQAAVLNVRIKYLEENLARRKEIAERYDEEFKRLNFILPLKQVGRVYQDYVIRYLDSERLRDYLKEKGVETTGYRLIPNHFYKKLKLNYILPHTENYLYYQLRLPCNQDLTDEEVDHVIKSVRSFYDK